MRINFTALVSKEVESGYSISCLDLGVTSQGETIDEAKMNIVEAVELYLESARDMGILEEVLEEVGIDLKTASDAIILSEYTTTPLQASFA